MINYDKYEETFNKFVNYEDLSSFLIEKLIFPRGDITFIDLPCGGGNLLLKMLRSRFKLVGVDASEEQSSTAKKVVGKNAKIFTADCFKIEEITKELDFIVIHCGNSFIQNLNLSKQSQFIKYLLGLKNVYKILIEYQNIEYFQHFKENTWYIKKLNESVEVKSLHNFLPGGKKVDFVFKDNKKWTHQHSVILYDFNIDAHDYLKNHDYKIFPAIYRNLKNNHYSHNIIEIKNKGF